MTEVPKIPPIPTPPAEPPAPETPPADGPEVGTPEWVRANPDAAYKEIQKERKEAGKYRIEAAANRDAAAKLAQLEAAQKTANEKALADQNKWQELAEQREADRLAAEARAEAATLSALKTQIAFEVGLTPALAKRMQGTTEEELRADAAELKGLMPAATPTPEVKGTKPGASPTTTTPAPGGTAAGETDAQRRARLNGTSGRALGTGKFVFNGNPEDLRGPVG